VGTLPVTVLVGLGAYRLSITFRTVMYRVGSVLLLVVSVQLLLRGLSALGWVPHAHIGEVVLW
jgi:sulfite exporter TauE/SafE